MPICNACGNQVSQGSTVCGSCLSTDLIQEEIPRPENKIKGLLAQGKSQFAGPIVIFAVIGLALVCGGLYETFSYTSTDKLVGGDAFNFIILACRGTSLICAGFFSGILSIVMAIIDLRLCTVRVNVILANPDLMRVTKKSG